MKKLSAVVLAALTASCSLFKPSIGKDEQSCGVEAISALESDAIADITKAATSSNADWETEAEADALAAAESLGGSALCALEVLAKDFDPGSSSSADAGTAPAPQLALVRSCAGAAGAPCSAGQARAKVVSQRIMSVVAATRAKRAGG